MKSRIASNKLTKAIYKHPFTIVDPPPSPLHNVNLLLSKYLLLEII